MDAWYVPDGESQFTHEIFDLTDQLFNNDPDSPYNTLDQTRWVLRIPIENAFGISEPAMFQATLSVTENTEQNKWITPSESQQDQQDRQSYIDQLETDISGLQFHTISGVEYKVESNVLYFQMPISVTNNLRIFYLNLDDLEAIDIDNYEIYQDITGQTYISGEFGFVGRPVIVIYDTQNYLLRYITPTLAAPEETPQPDVLPDSFLDTAVCSDLNFVYQCILGNIVNQTDDCVGVSDDVIRNYLFLYGHVQAMEHRHFETAQEYFKVLVRRFHKCGSKHDKCACNLNKIQVLTSCGCKR